MYGCARSSSARSTPGWVSSRLRDRRRRIGLTTPAGIWEAIEKLNTLVDDSDPDVSLRRRSFTRSAAGADMGPVCSSRPASLRSSTCCRPRRRFAGMGSPSGCRSPASSTTSASSCTSLALSEWPRCGCLTHADCAGSGTQGPMGRRRCTSRSYLGL